MARTYGAQLVASHRMPHDHGPSNLQRIQGRRYIVAEPVGGVARGQRTRVAEAAPRDAIDMTPLSVWEQICRIPAPCFPVPPASPRTPRPTPVEHFEFHVFFDRHEPNAALRRIAELCPLGRAPQLELHRLQLRTAHHRAAGTELPFVTAIDLRDSEFDGWSLRP
jgi:hypothetical protein